MKHFVLDMKVHKGLERGGTPEQMQLDSDSFPAPVWVEYSHVFDTELGAVGKCIEEVEIYLRQLDIREKRLEDGSPRA
jgi:hypothetical protein